MAEDWIKFNLVRPPAVFIICTILPLVKATKERKKKTKAMKKLAAQGFVHLVVSWHSHNDIAVANASG